MNLPYGSGIQDQLIFSALIAGSSPMWAPILSAGNPMLAGAIGGAVAVAGGRYVSSMMNKRSTSMQELAMSTAAGAATGALVAGFANNINYFGDYTANIVYAGTAAATDYAYDLYKKGKY